MANFLTGGLSGGANYVTSVLSENKGKPLNVIESLAGGDRVGAITALLGDGTEDAQPKDWRVRLSLGPTAQYLYRDLDNNLMAPLRQTNGCIWPYTPNVTMSYSATYNNNNPSHSNYTLPTYQNSSVSAIGISGDFTAQTSEEAKYLLACMMFLRGSTKMFWGNSPNAGMPPPMLYLNGFGQHFFPNVPVVITDYTANLPETVDYIEVLDSNETVNNSRKATSGDVTRVPSSVTMSVTCMPIYSRQKIRDFTFEQFARGELVGNESIVNGPFKGGFV